MGTDAQVLHICIVCYVIDKISHVYTRISDTSSISPYPPRDPVGFFSVQASHRLNQILPSSHAATLAYPRLASVASISLHTQGSRHRRAASHFPFLDHQPFLPNPRIKPHN